MSSFPQSSASDSPEASVHRTTDSSSRMPNGSVGDTSTNTSASSFSDDGAQDSTMNTQVSSPSNDRDLEANTNASIASSSVPSQDGAHAVNTIALSSHAPTYSPQTPDGAHGANTIAPSSHAPTYSPQTPDGAHGANTIAPSSHAPTYSPQAHVPPVRYTMTRNPCPPSFLPPWPPVWPSRSRFAELIPDYNVTDLKPFRFKSPGPYLSIWRRREVAVLALVRFYNMCFAWNPTMPFPPSQPWHKSPHEAWPLDTLNTFFGRLDKNGLNLADRMLPNITPPCFTAPELYALILMGPSPADFITVGCLNLLVDNFMQITGTRPEQLIDMLLYAY